MKKHFIFIPLATFALMIATFVGYQNGRAWAQASEVAVGEPQASVAEKISTIEKNTPPSVPEVAQTPVTESAKNAAAAKDESISVTADQLEYHEKEQNYRAIGNALITRGTTRLSADETIAHFTKSETDGPQITTAEALGHVVIVSGEKSDTRLVGDKGIYNVQEQHAVLTGRELLLTTPQETVSASKSMEYFEKEQKAIARGEAIARKDDQTIVADELIAYLAKDKTGALALKRVEATGHIIITTAQEIAQAERGVYDVIGQKADLDGNVKITRGQNQLNGDHAVMDLASGVSRLLSSRDKNSRVNGLLMPSEDQQLLDKKSQAGAKDVQ